MTRQQNSRQKNRPLTHLTLAVALALALLALPLAAAPTDTAPPLDNEVTATLDLDTGQTPAQLVAFESNKVNLDRSATTCQQSFLDTSQTEQLDVKIKQGLRGDSVIGISGASYATLMDEIDLRLEQSATARSAVST